MTVDANAAQEFKLDILARVENLENVRDSGAIARNAEALKQTIEQWNKMYINLDTRVTAMENNILNMLTTVKDIQDNNTLALQKLRGHGPTE